MELRLDRTFFTDKSTIGSLCVDGVFECFTLEDNAAIAIPTGRYQVVVTYSIRFKTMLPILLNVPGRSGIRVHAGNTEADTEGCILVGQARGADWIGNSRLALNALLMKLAHRHAVWITVSTLER